MAAEVGEVWRYLSEGEEEEVLTPGEKKNVKVSVEPEEEVPNDFFGSNEGFVKYMNKVWDGHSYFSRRRSDRVLRIPTSQLVEELKDKERDLGFEVSLNRNRGSLLMREKVRNRLKEFGAGGSLSSLTWYQIEVYDSSTYIQVYLSCDEKRKVWEIQETRHCTPWFTVPFQLREDEKNTGQNSPEGKSCLNNLKCLNKVSEALVKQQEEAKTDFQLSNTMFGFALWLVCEGRAGKLSNLPKHVNVFQLRHNSAKETYPEVGEYLE